MQCNRTVKHSLVWMLFLRLPLHCSFLSIPSNQSEHSHTLQEEKIKVKVKKGAYISLMYIVNNSILSQNKNYLFETYCINQLLFATTLFHNLLHVVPKLILIAAINFMIRM